MAEASLTFCGRNLVTVRLDPNSISGQDVAGTPALNLPFELQLLPGGDQKNIGYTLIRLSGKVQSQAVGELALFDAGPLAEVPRPNGYFSQHNATVELNRLKVSRFEDARAGRDARLQFRLTGLIWSDTPLHFEAAHAANHLEIVVPRSLWIDRVLTPWKLSTTRILEIQFPNGTAGEHFRTAYARVEEAEKFFANGQYKQVLVTLRLSLEALAQSFGFSQVGRDFFEFLFASVHVEKRQKARDALIGIYKFLHLGPHEQANATSDDQTIITRQDARFALLLIQTTFEYIIP